MKLVFATNNAHKLSEVNNKLQGRINLLGLSDIGCNEEIPENQETLEGNAQEKAQYIFDRYGLNCFADDTGLEVEALNGEPGVYSARYAGEQKDSVQNMSKLLLEMENKDNRNARFRSVFCLILNGETFFFEGIVNGQIIRNPRGDSGFGYDPVFVPKGSNSTFAEMDLGEKNKISHRAIATQELVNFLLSKNA